MEPRHGCTARDVRASGRVRPRRSFSPAGRSSAASARAGPPAGLLQGSDPCHPGHRPSGGILIPLLFTPHQFSVFPLWLL